jgi:hypothetical protein
LRDRSLVLRHRYRLALVSWGQYFFDSAALNASLLNIESASKRFSLAFSASSYVSRLRSSVSIPRYFFRQV